MNFYDYLFFGGIILAVIYAYWSHKRGDDHLFV